MDQAPHHGRGFVWERGSFARHMEACPFDAPADEVATYFRELYPNLDEAEWKMTRFLNVQAYMRKVYHIEAIRCEFIKVADGYVEIHPSLFEAAWAYLKDVPTEFLGMNPPVAQILKIARQFRKEREEEGA